MNEIIESFQEVNWPLIAPILILSLVLMIVALIDCIKHDKTNGPQWIWILVIVFVNFFGPILYFLFGRRND
ncbi:PLD nuclease N-terminal domain-containing protein [Salipaludibacillus daqingensis]|uniref:PLD nuclease N-terminal domain-containing protein n=1 Tax=Salipaludibacillus daqingensis TaxID=3041001 RepID=UPI002476ADDD|nr:PLD nuclease N-terminal domain-containing protein [Salipaludibacillus daqingensis]